MAQDSSSGQLAFPIAGEDKASFENFFIGNNQELVAALSVSAQNIDARVLYFYGPDGSGKSHLMYAVMRAAKQAGTKTSYLSLNDHYVSPEMLTVVDVSGMVCVDNIQEWAGNNEHERALFTLFEQIKHAGGRLIVSAKQAPDASDFGIRDLVSRLSSGLIYPLQELNDEQRLQALKMRADHRGLSINDDVLKFLVSRLSRDNNDLFSFLDKMDKVSLAEKRKITIPFLQGLLSG